MTSRTLEAGPLLGRPRSVNDPAPQVNTAAQRTAAATTANGGICCVCGRLLHAGVGVTVTMSQAEPDGKKCLKDTFHKKIMHNESKNEYQKAFKETINISCT